MQPNTDNIPKTKELHGVATLKSLYTYLRFLENASELKRKMPDFFQPKEREGRFVGDQQTRRD